MKQVMLLMLMLCLGIIAGYAKENVYHERHERQPSYYKKGHYYPHYHRYGRFHHPYHGRGTTSTEWKIPTHRPYTPQYSCKGHDCCSKH